MTIRVMWLLNHGTARKFDLIMLRKIGIEEIYTPKSFPQQINFRSASTDWETDRNLSIPKDELDILNNADWYREPGKEAWEIANRYFKVIFFIVHHTDMVRSAAKNFKGALIWRSFGLDRTINYTKILQFEPRKRNEERLIQCGARFWMGNAYQNLPDVEGPFLKSRNLFLPIGMHDCSIHDKWSGAKKEILFVCPDLGFNEFYKNIYNDFRENFSEFNYSIGGAQPINIFDPHVLGYVPLEEHENNMREFRVMFYHSTEPYHIHYHPFEAIRAGMPLVFMAGGLLDQMGGCSQPGRCSSISEAKQKIRRILNDDWNLIKKIKESQIRLLESMRPENCLDAWRIGFDKVLSCLGDAQATPAIIATRKKKRIAVIVPVGYRGGSLRGAKLLAQALWTGSRQWKEDADIVFGHLDDSSIYSDEEFDDLHPEISRRAFFWRDMDIAAGRRAMAYAGHDCNAATSTTIVPDDGMQQFMDCDLWVFISDRLSLPLLPLRPYVCMIYDYLQRYQKFLPHGEDQVFLNAARMADRVLVTTKFTERDAYQYAGVDPEKIRRVPMLAPNFGEELSLGAQSSRPGYFLWTTNAAPHKNHVNAIAALKDYYEIYDGQLECRVTGVDTKKLLKRGLDYLRPANELVQNSRLLRKRVSWLGELANRNYARELAGAAFLWHPALIDNGTFSVIEAARMNVPSLSSDYPAMREIDEQFKLNLSWMDPRKPKYMAKGLKAMEENYCLLRSSLPSREELTSQDVENLASEYWKVLRECL